MALKTASIETTQRWCYRIGVGVMVACAAHAINGGWHLADGYWLKGVILAGLMVAATVGAGLLPTMFGALLGRRIWGGAAMVGVVMALCFAGEIVGNTIAMGHTRNSSTTLANVADTQVQDRRKSISDTEKSIATIEGIVGDRSKVAGWLSTKPAKAWQADIANLEGDKLFARSKQCANVTLPDSRAHCDKLNEARANLAVAVKHEQDEAELKRLKDKLVELRDASRTDKPGLSAARTHSDNIVRASGFITGEWVADVSSDARTRADFGVTMFMALFMALVPGGLIYAGSVDLSAPRDRRPGNLARVFAWLRGEKIKTEPITEPARTVMAPAAPVSTPAPAAAVPQQIVHRIEPSIPQDCLVRLRRIAA